MADVRVLVVDDSAAMRALFCDILDNAKGVTVCGVAKNADDAREQLEKLRPDVLTLDVEMPGKSGMEFLEEIMASAPLPVIMLSSITQAGTGTARRALELGAVHCFPKPLHTSREEFDATVRQLGDIVIRAANGELQPGGCDGDGGGSTYRSDGRIVALACGAAGIETARQVLAAYDTGCPPTIVLFDAEPGAVENAVRAMRQSLPCQLGDAVDGVALEPGKVWLAHDSARHVIIEAGTPAAPQVDRARSGQWSSPLGRSPVRLARAQRNRGGGRVADGKRYRRRARARDSWRGQGQVVRAAPRRLCPARPL